MLQFSIIRPGFLVSLKTTVRGGVSYSRRDIAAPVATDGAPAAAADPAAEVSAWETVRAIADAAEHRRAIETRGRCRTLIVRHCAQSSFGLLCPEANEPELSAAIREAQQLADEFNRGARFSRVEVFTLAGRIADIGKGLGQGIKNFKQGLKEANDDDDKDEKAEKSEKSEKKEAKSKPKDESPKEA